MTEFSFTPPFPARPAATASTLGLLRTARHNLLAIWPDPAFEGGSFSYRVLGRRIHVVSTPDVVKQVFVDGAKDYERKSAQQRQALKPVVGDGLIISDGEKWRARRRVVAPVTHVSRLPAFVPIMTNGATALVRSWHALPSGTEVDVLTEMGTLGAEIIIASIFGEHVPQVSAASLVTAFGSYLSKVGQIDLLALLGLPDSIPRLRGLKARLAARFIKRSLDRMIDAILQDPKGTSLLRDMAQVTHDGRPVLDRAAFRNEAAVMFLAGHETTANTLAWAIYILSQDPVSEARLLAEVDAVLGSRAAKFEDLDKLPFTRAVVQETLRLYPPVPIQARVAGVDGAIGPTPVRAGELVMLNAWLLHRHRDVWTNPDQFRPDRFLPGGSGVPSRYAYIPFGIGPRVCTGASFGQTEAIICLATLFQHFRFRLRAGFAVNATCRLSLRPSPSLPMRLEARRPIDPDPTRPSLRH